MSVLAKRGAPPSIPIRNASGSAWSARANSSMKLSVPKTCIASSPPRKYPARNGKSAAIALDDRLPHSAPAVRLTECVFVGGSQAFQFTGRGSVIASNCAFAPHHAVFHLHGTAPETTVRLEHCSAFLEDSSLFLLDDAASARIAAGHCLFSRPVGDPTDHSGADAVLIRQVGIGAGDVSYRGLVGADRMPDSGYMRAKVNQEKLIEAGGVPYTIVRATQFFEFLSAIAGQGAGTVRVPDAPMQPMAADDVAAALADVAVASPANGVLEVAGPESLSMAAFVGKALAASGDTRSVVADKQARYYGAALDEQGLKPRGANPRIAPTRFEAWRDRSAARA